MDMLARREHSERELACKLAGRGYDESVVGETVSGLVADGLLSNQRFVESFVHSRYQRGQGPLKIRAGLRERGIDDDAIGACLDTYAGEWRELASRVREKKFGTALPGDYRERSRQMRFLQQRGFGPEQIHALFRDEDW
jgi:regulatory protein